MYESFENDPSCSRRGTKVTALQYNRTCQRLLPNNSISRWKSLLYAWTNLQLAEHVYIILETPVKLNTQLGLWIWCSMLPIYNEWARKERTKTTCAAPLIALKTLAVNVERIEKEHRGKRDKMGMLSSLLNIPLNMPQNTIFLSLLYASTLYIWNKIAK